MAIFHAGKYWNDPQDRTAEERAELYGDADYKRGPMRVQIPAYTDRWMMGDRFGEIVKITRPSKWTCGVRASLLTKNPHAPRVNIAHVKLDKSGKTVRVVFDDCEVVS